MNWDAVGAIGEVAGAIAVFATLVYLAIQIRQNTRSVRAASSLSFAQLNLDFSAMLITNEKVARLYRLGLEDSTEFTEDQAAQFDALMIAMFRGSQNLFQQHRQSLLDEEEWQSVSRNMLWIFGQPGVARWWKSRRVVFSDSFRRFLESGGTEAE